MFLQTLLLNMRRKQVGRRPEIQLPFRQNPSRQQRVDPNILGPELSCEHACQARDRRLGSRVDRIAGVPHDIGNRREIDDRTPACPLHSLSDPLGREKMRAKVHVDASIPILHRIGVQVVARVVRRIVDQYGNIAVFRRRLINRPPESVNVRDVAGNVQRRVAVFLFQIFCKRRGVRTLDERHLRALPDESFGKGGADSGTAPCDENRLARQIVEFRIHEFPRFAVS